MGESGVPRPPTPPPERGGGESLRNILDRPHVGGHVLAHGAVAAGRRQHQLPALVADRAAQPVDLRLRGHRDESVRRQVQETPNAPDKLRDFILGKAVFEAEHRPRMRDLGERRGWSRSQSLRRRVCSDELRKLLFKLAVLADQRVIFRVADLRRVLVVVEPVVARDLLREPHQAVGGLRLADRLSHARRRFPRAG